MQSLMWLGVLAHVIATSLMLVVLDVLPRGLRQHLLPDGFRGKLFTGLKTTAALWRTAACNLHPTLRAEAPVPPDLPVLLEQLQDACTSSTGSVSVSVRGLAQETTLSKLGSAGRPLVVALGSCTHPPFLSALPSLVSLPGTITFKPGGSGGLPAGVSAVDDAGLANSWLSSGQELAGVYTYVCQDTRHGDFHYLFRYHAFWMRPAAMALLHALGSLLVKMLLMHAYAALFMLLAQANCRDAWVAELRRRADRFRRLVWPRPPVRLIAVEPGDLCAFCHEELLQAAPGDSSPATGPDAVHHRSCRWGCGKAVHTACAANWGRNACVYCSAPMS